MKFRLFVISSVLLFVATLMAVWVDFDREWKKYQAEFNKIEYDKTKAELDDLKKSIDSDPDFKKVESQFKASEEKFNSADFKEKQDEMSKKITKLKYNLYVAERDAKFTKSTMGALDYQIARVASEGKSTDSLIAEKQQLESKYAEQQKVADDAKKELESAENSVKNSQKDYLALKSQFEDKYSKIDLLEKKIQAIQKRPLEINQVLVPQLNNTVDRCMTCHVAANRDGFEDKKYPKVFQTHPNKDLFLVKHNVKDFGCVVCHQGQGLSTKKDKAHGWVEFWDKPMFKGKQVEASCIKCHKTTDEIPADFFNKGKELVTTSNCMACHKIEGQPAGLRNGPPLIQASSKLNPSWMVNWVENPRHYLPKSKMPTFPLAKEDAVAITTYILSTSDSNYGAKKNVIPNSSLAPQGEKVFAAKGCNSCHAIKGQGANVGPDLGRIASKTNPTWLFNWIKNPQSYHPTTIMPNMGLSDNETLAVVSWLQQNKWESLPQVQIDLNNKELADKGKKLMKDYNCASCHNAVGLKAGQNAPELTGEAEKDIHKFDFGYAHKDPERGIYHLRESYIYNKIRTPGAYNDFVKGKMPRFWFTDEQTSAVYTYIMGVTGKHDSIPYNYIYKPKNVEESNEETKGK
jgi:mono/diheme cytochrome c family protein